MTAEEVVTTDGIPDEMVAGTVITGLLIPEKFRDWMESNDPGYIGFSNRGTECPLTCYLRGSIPPESSITVEIVGGAQVWYWTTLGHGLASVPVPEWARKFMRVIDDHGHRTGHSVAVTAEEGLFALRGALA